MPDSFSELCLDPFELVLEDVRQGRMIVMVDDCNRENEGDLMIAAEKVNSDAINFMIQHGRGLICMSMPEQHVREIGIPLQVTESAAVFGTNFGVCFDHVSVARSGITAEARATSIRSAISAQAKPEDFVTPGYVVPVVAVPGGVLKRRGQTEGSVDIARLAGLQPGGVICEIMGDDGEMLRGAQLQQFCQRHQLRLTSVEEIVQYRMHQEVCVRRVVEKEINDFHGVGQLSFFAKSKERAKMRVVVYVDDVDGKEHIAFVCGKPSDGALVRLHSECLTGDVFGSRRCDCGFQFQTAMEQMFREGAGVLVYLHQEGRGIGLGNKLRAYELQDKGLDTVDANVQLGFAADSRDYRVGAQILADLGLRVVRLMTNNPQKMESLESFGIRVTERVPVAMTGDDHNAEYLKTKRDRMGHLF